MTNIKPAKTIDEQIEILESRGIIIKNKEKARFILGNTNYYRFTAYLLPYKKEDGSFDYISFDEINALYNFDKEFRILLMSALENIEVSFRTYIAYTLAIAYGPLGYMDRDHFIDSNFHNNFLLSLRKEKENNSNKPFIAHHNEKYDGKLPIWVATEIMTFGILSKLYSNMLPADKTYIKNNFCNIQTNISTSWLQSLTHIRNQCAHYGRIYNTSFPKIKIKKTDREYCPNDKRIFPYILAIKYLIVDKVEWDKIFIKLQQLISNYEDYIDLNLIGFPQNWVEVLSKPR